MTDYIDTDRPHQTDTPHVVPLGRTQYESAIVSLAAGGTLKDPRLAFASTAYKYGLVRDCDFQIIFDHAAYDTGRERFAPPGPMNVRVKLGVVHQKGIRPAFTLVPTMFVPFAPTQAFRGGLLAFWGWEMPLGFELEMNAGFLASSKPKPPFVLVLATALTKRIIGQLKGFIDIYATGWDIQLGTGLLLPLTPDVQIDAGTYIGVNGDVAGATPFIGFSFRR
jgi:hypothetical protein